LLFWPAPEQKITAVTSPGHSSRLSRLGPAVWALYESTFKDAFVMDWTHEEATTELAARLQVIDLG